MLKSILNSTRQGIMLIYNILENCRKCPQTVLSVLSAVGGVYISETDKTNVLETRRSGRCLAGANNQTKRLSEQPGIWAYAKNNNIIHFNVGYIYRII